MKKTSLFALVMVIFSILIAQQTNTIDIVNFEQALSEISDYIYEKAPKGRSLLFLNIQSSSTSQSEYIIEELTSISVNEKQLDVVNRQEIEQILAEQSFQISGNVADSEAVRLGQMSGAQTIITGSIRSAGNNIYRLSIRIIDVETAKVLGIVNKNIEIGQTTAALMGIGTIGETRPTARTTSTPTPTIQSSIVYKIGDTGPAGGIVFYDKGDYSEGWRFLEAAPADLEASARWGLNGTDCPDTYLETGTGKGNTATIINVLTTKRESNCAAQICNELVVNGFNDWFLPSKDELNLMYQNLKKKGYGIFTTKTYWSSSCTNRNTGKSTYYQSFFDGIQYYTSNIDTRSDKRVVRAVRAF